LEEKISFWRPILELIWYLKKNTRQFCGFCGYVSLSTSGCAKGNYQYFVEKKGVVVICVPDTGPVTSLLGLAVSLLVFIHRCRSNPKKS
jgi:hypothetical protein